MRYTVANGNGESGTVDREPDLTRTDTASPEVGVHSHEGRSESQGEVPVDQATSESQGDVPIDQPTNESQESRDGAVALQGKDEPKSSPPAKPNIYNLFAISVSLVRTNHCTV